MDANDKTFWRALIAHAVRAAMRDMVVIERFPELVADKFFARLQEVQAIELRTQKEKPDACETESQD